MISVIIPTLEEEKYLPLLLKDIKKQTVQPEEIIVVDARSKDKTVEIAKRKDAKVIITKKGVSHQRNLAAKKARGDWLLFIDADMRLPDKDTIKKMIPNNNDTVAVVPRMTVEEKHRSLHHRVFTEPGNIIARFFPHHTARGGCLLVQRAAFKRIGGFNVGMAVSEDLDLGRRIARVGRVQYANVTVHESNRRYARHGVIQVVVEWWINGAWSSIFRKSYVKERSNIR